MLTVFSASFIELQHIIICWIVSLEVDFVLELEVYTVLIIYCSVYIGLYIIVILIVEG